jgi:hypothetical protein
MSANRTSVDTTAADADRAAIRSELAQIRRLRELLEERLASRRSRRPAATDEALVAGIGARTGTGHLFYATDLLAKATGDAAFLGLLTSHGADTARRLGVRLKLLSDQGSPGGLTVRRHGRDRDGARWSIESASP